MNEVLHQIGRWGVVPVVTLDKGGDAPPLGRALLAGGLPCAEITFRTPAAAEAIRRMTAACPEMVVGAGTVLTVTQAEQAVTAGAQFIVTPGFDPAVVDWCVSRKVPIVPGVMTPTEINRALGKGLNLLKFFPAEAAGGVTTLKAISGPYQGVKFIPTGGINSGNLAAYLCLPAVHACGGSWLVRKQLIEENQFTQITRLAAEAVALAADCR